MASKNARKKTKKRSEERSGKKTEKITEKEAEKEAEKEKIVFRSSLFLKGLPENKNTFLAGRLRFNIESKATEMRQ